jgi:hypothetical protein
MIAPARPVPLDLSAAFARFRNADPERLHFGLGRHGVQRDEPIFRQPLALAAKGVEFAVSG